jgi:ATP-dependent Lhr-like helicase
VLERLQGYAAPAAAWETEILPRRVRGYRPAALDELLAGGEWLWRASAAGKDEPLVALVLRGFSGGWPAESESPAETQDECRVLDLLRDRGACFATDLARFSGLDPSRLRGVLRALMLQGQVTNDRFDPLRPGAAAMDTALAEAAAIRSGRSRRVRPRRVNAATPEGRWSLPDQPADDHDAHLGAWIDALLDRYGILARELVELDSWAPRWAELAPLLARSELRGELRRGYFVEGLSGVQYAGEDVVEELSRLAGSSNDSAADVLLSATDPANLYGTSAPLDIPLLEGGTARLNRIPGNHLVMRAGRPVLVIEAYGRRLTGLPSASQAELHAALGRLLELARSCRQVLKVETYNGEPALGSSIAARLSELGFVRDYPGMTYYAAWAPAGSSVSSSTLK